MLTDLIAAQPADATVILGAPGHANLWPTLDGRGLDKTALSALALVLQGKPTTPATLGIHKLSFQLLADEGADGPWLEQLPTDLTTALAMLAHEQLADAAKRWAAVSEAGLQRWPPAELQAFVAELSAFAASAVAQDLPLLLWSCD